VTGKKTDGAFKQTDSPLGLLPTSQSSVLKVPQIQHIKYNKCHLETNISTFPHSQNPQCYQK